MSNAALAFFSGLGGGYFQGTQYADQLARLAKQDQRAQETHEAQMTEERRRQATEQAVQQAARPLVAASGGMSRPDYADDRDVGSDPTVTLAPTATANTPDATRARIAAAVLPYDPERADRLTQAGKSAALTDLQLKEAQATEADRSWRRKLGVAVMGGHQGLADLGTQAEFGPMAGKKVQAVPSADGKTVTYSTVGDDGTLTPVPGATYTNDETGVAHAAYALDKLVTPEARIQSLRADQKEAREGAKTTAEIGELGARGKYYAANAEAVTTKADKLADRMSEADKAALATINKQRETINTEITKAQAGGMWQEESPNAQLLRKSLNTLALQQRAILNRYPADDTPASTPDPLGLRKAPGAPAQPGAPSPTKVTPQLQAQRDADAGALRIRTEYKGDVAAAEADIPKFQKIVDAQKEPDAKSIYQREVDILKAGVSAVKADAAKAPPAAPVAPRPAAAAGMGATGAAPAAPALPAPAAAAGTELDAARNNLTQAQATLLSYSPRKQAQDPQGFAAAKDAVTQAQQRVGTAQAAWQQTLGPVPPVAARAGFKL